MTTGDWKHPRGSEAGGTHLRIRGRGFSDKEAPDNKVFVGGKECRVIQYYTTPTQIVCETPPGLDDGEGHNLPIEVLVDRKRYAVAEHHRYAYYESRTPLFYYAFPKEVMVGGNVDFHGHFRGVKEKEDVRSLDIGGGRCELKGGDEDAAASGTDLRSVLPCRVDRSFPIGRYNVSVHVANDYGRAQTHPTARYPRPYGNQYNAQFKLADSDPYMLVIHPAVASVSHSHGSTAGGHTITIRGKGFGDSAGGVRVKTQGRPCVVGTAADTEITCTTAANPEAAPGLFPGGRGVRREQWNGKSNVNNIHKYGPAEISEVIPNFETERNHGNKYTQRKRAFFHPPRTGVYRFWTASDDSSELYLHDRQQANATIAASAPPPGVCDGCPAVVENPITQITAWTMTFLGQASDTEGRYPKNRQRSAPLFLYSNRTYLLEGRHHEGGGGDFFHLAVEVPSDTMQWDSKREVQKIVIKPLNDREVHAIDLGEGGIDGTYRLSYSFYNSGKQRNETVITNKILWDENPREALLGAMGDKVQEDLAVERNASAGTVWLVEWKDLAKGQRQLLEVVDNRLVCERKVELIDAPEAVTPSPLESNSTGAPGASPASPAANGTDSDPTVAAPNTAANGTDSDPTVAAPSTAADGAEAAAPPPAATSRRLQQQAVEEVPNPCPEGAEVCAFGLPGNESATEPEAPAAAPKFYFQNVTCLAGTFRVAEGAPPLEGNYGLGLGGDSMVSLAHTASAGDVEDKLSALGVRVEVDKHDHGGRGGAYGVTLQLEWVEAGDQPPLVLNTSLLEQPMNGAVDAEVITVLDGGKDLFMWPIPGDYLSTAEDTPQVQVEVKSKDGWLSASCTGVCSYSALARSTSEIRKVSNSTFANGTTLVRVEGKNLRGAEADTTISVGGAACTPLNPYSAGLFGNGTHLECVLAQGGQAGIQPLKVRTTFGLAGYEKKCINNETNVDTSGAFVGTSSVDDSTPPALTNNFTSNATLCDYLEDQVAETFSFTNPLVLSDVRPNTAPFTGGSLVTIAGVGFGPGFGPDGAQIRVEIGGHAAPIVNGSQNATHMVVRAPLGAPGDVTGRVVVNGVEATFDFNYNSNVPELRTVAPAEAPVGVRQELTLSGVGFSPVPEENVVKVGQEACAVMTATSDGLKCSIIGFVPGKYPVSVETRGVKSYGKVDFSYFLEITSVSPATGSFLGGTVLTITGRGFSGTQWDIVSVGESQCEIVESSFAEIKCIVPRRDSVASVRQSAGPLRVSVAIKNIHAECKAGTEAGCLFAYSEAPALQGIVQTNVTGTANLVIQTAGMAADTSLGVYLVEGRPGFVPSYSELLEMDRCKVMQFDPDTGLLGCEVSEIQAAQYSLYVHGKEAGIANGTAVLAYTSEITSMPTLVSLAGGEIKVTGSGFGPKTQVTVGGVESQVVTHSPSELRFTAPSNTDKAVSAVSITTGEYEAVCKLQPATTDPPNGTAEAASACRLTYEESLTPALTRVVKFSNASSNVESLVDYVVIEGSGFSTDAGSNRVVYFGPEEVEVVDASEDLLRVLYDKVPAGLHNVRVMVEGKGYPEGNGYPFEKQFQLQSMAPAFGSVGGGTRVTITSNGFPNAAQAPVVSICNAACTVVESTFERIVCDTAALHTPDWDQQLDYVEDQLLNERGTPFSGRKGDPVIQGQPPWKWMEWLYSRFRGRVPAALDGNVATAMEVWNQNDAYLGLDFGPFERVGLSNVRIFPASEDGANRLVGAVVQGSNDGENWDTLMSIEEKPLAGYNTIWCTSDDVCPFTSAAYAKGASLRYDRLYRYVRLLAKSDRFRVAELEFYGKPFSAAAAEQDRVGSDVASYACPVHIQPVEGGAPAGLGRYGEIELPSTFTYDAPATARVQAVHPDHGTTLGGTEVTVAGDNFGNATGEIQVIIDAVPCTVTAVSKREIKCVTGARVAIVEPSIRVVLGNSDAVIGGGASFTYIDRWSPETTWGGLGLPDEGDSVVIPKGQTVLLDVSPPRLVLLVVEGELIFEDAQDLELQATYIFIRGGRLQVGTEEAPFKHRATFTLFGERDETPELPIYGAKVIALRRGVLDLHGTPTVKTWTRLASTAAAGSTTLDLADPVDWEAGDRIVLASSGVDMDEAEELEVVAVTNSNKTVEVATPLKFKHSGETNEFSAGSLQATETTKVLDTRAEVGLLTRNVKVQGDAASTNSQFGAHIMVASPDEGSSTARLSYVECTRCGQAFRLGRYPIHYHMLGKVHARYVKGCAVHHTFNRAVTIHGVHYLRVQDNVAYDTMGHTYFIEDGIEMLNRVENNLGLLTRASFSLLDTDTTPATFWITNPNNFFKGNAAAGSERYGFWFDLQKHPTGPSATDDICPPGLPLGEFSDNVAHSNGRYGLRLFNQYVPRLSPCKWASSDHLKHPLVTAKFERFTSYMNGRSGAIGSVIGDVRFIEFAVADNAAAGIEATDVVTAAPGAGVYDSLFVAHSPGAAWPPGQKDVGGARAGNVVGVFAPQSENFTVEGNVFVNYDKTDEDGVSTSVFSTCNHCDFPNTKCNGAKTTLVSKAVYINSPRIVQWNIPFKGILKDLDGSTLGEPGYLSAPWPHLSEDCIPASSKAIAGLPAGAAFTDGGLLCFDRNLVRLAVSDQKPYGTFVNKPLYVHPFRSAQSPDALELSAVPYRHMKWHEPANGWAIALSEGRTYRIFSSDYAADFDEVQLEVSGLVPGEHVYLAVNHTEPWDHFVLTVGDGREEDPSLLALPDPLSETGSAYHDKMASVLYVLFSGNGMPPATAQRVRIHANRCPKDGCPLPEVVNAEKEPFLRAWSNSTQWPNGTLPRAGADVSIRPEWRLVLDIDPPALGRLDVHGELLFDETKPRTKLEAESVVVLGGSLVAGSAAKPFLGDIEIVLNGDRFSPFVAVSEGLDTGNKALVVLGGMQLYGIPRNRLWTHLQAPGLPGDQQIAVEEEVDWMVGEQIAIAPSQFDQFETEIFTIAARQGNLLTLDAPLKHLHYGAAALDVVNGVEIEIRAEVALLSRNIKIRGSATSDEYGCHVLVSSLVDEAMMAAYVGHAELDHVEIANCGQYETTRHALNIMDTANGTSVTSSAVWGSHNSGIHVKNSEGMMEAPVRIESNTVVDVRGSSIEVFGSENVVVSRNLAFLAKKRSAVAGWERFETVANYNLCVWDYAANRKAEPCKNLRARDNVAAGSHHAGFLVHGEACGAQASNFRGNAAHTARVGAVVIGAGSCTRFADFAAAKMVEVGFVLPVNAINPLGVEVEDVLLVDNHVGISVPQGCAARIGETCASSVSNVTIVGYSANPGCEGACKGGEYSGCTGRRGIQLGAADGGHKFPRAPPYRPWYKVKKDAAFGGITEVSGVTFAGFTRYGNTQCPEGPGMRSAAVASQPAASDSSPVHTFSGVSLSDVAEDAILYLDEPDPGWLNPTDCVDMQCTGLKNLVVKDEDGTLFGAKGQAVSRNVMAVGFDPRCQLKPAWNAFFCSGGSDYDVLFFESLDSDKYSRRLQPVEVSNARNGYVNFLNCHMDRRWDAGYTSLLRLSRFPAIVEHGLGYNVSFTGTNPKKLRFGFNQGAARQAGKKGLVLQLRYGNPQLHRLFVGDREVGRTQGRAVGPEDPAGSFTWDNVSRALRFVVKGGADVVIRTINAVHVSLTLASTVEDFYDKGGTEQFVSALAHSLSIDPKRIKVVEVVALQGRRLTRRLLGEAGVKVVFAVVSQMELELEERGVSGVAPQNATVPVADAGAGPVEAPAPVGNLTAAEPAGGGGGLEVEAEDFGAEIMDGAELEAIAEVIQEKAAANELLAAAGPNATSAFAAVEVAAVEVEASLPPEVPCLPACRGSSTCVKGQCVCDTPELVYIGAALLNRTAPATAAGALENVEWCLNPFGPRPPPPGPPLGREPPRVATVASTGERDAAATVVALSASLGGVVFLGALALAINRAAAGKRAEGRAARENDTSHVGPDAFSAVVPSQPEKARSFITRNVLKMFSSDSFDRKATKGDPSRPGKLPANHVALGIAVPNQVEPPPLLAGGGAGGPPLLRSASGLSAQEVNENYQEAVALMANTGGARAAFAELERMKAPHRALEGVMGLVFTALGYPEAQCADWSEIRKTMHQKNWKADVHRFDIAEASPLLKQKLGKQLKALADRTGGEQEVLKHLSEPVRVLWHWLKAIALDEHLSLLRRVRDW